MTAEDAPVDRALARMWDEHVSPSRGPKPGLTVERIVQAAIAIADAEGFEALSMRRVASELGAGTMSLYRYVRDKDELIALAVDAVFGESLFSSSPPVDWRAQLERSAQRLWSICRRHPWVVPMISSVRPQIGPNGMAHMEQTLNVLEGIGLEYPTMLRIYLTLTGYVQGAAMNVAAEIEAERRTGMTMVQWWESQGPLLTRILASGRFPLIAKYDSDDIDPSTEEWFEFGLQRLLDGIEGYVKANRLN